jgi:CRP/FNR family cyclic AMP-dependent transcriptional regulator
MERLTIGAVEFQSLAHIIHLIDIFKPFKGEQLDKILAHILLFDFKPGEVVFKTGAPAEAFYIVHEGTVKLLFKWGFLWLSRKRAFLGPGNIFGEMALLENRPHSATAVTKTGVKLFVILRPDFEALVRLNPAFAEEIRQIAALRHFQTSH